MILQELLLLIKEGSIKHFTIVFLIIVSIIIVVVLELEE